MSIIDSLKRLERSGQENSRATKKLKESANELADFIINSCPYKVVLPMGYKVSKVVYYNSHKMVDPRDGLDYCLMTPYKFSDQHNDGYEILGVKNDGMTTYGTYLRIASRETVLKFAKDVSDGLIDKIADFLDKLKMQADQATQTLDSKLEEAQTNIMEDILNTAMARQLPGVLLKSNVDVE
jgi:hypothetical protein